MVFIKYPKIKKLGDKTTIGIWDGDVYIEEKIDGANFRFGWVDGIFRVGTRNVDYTNVRPDNWPKRFRKAFDYAYEIKDLLKPNMIYFAEASIPHTIPYDFDNMPPFIGFDIFDLNTMRFVDYDTKVALFNDAGVQVVPLVAHVKGKPDIENLYDMIPQSAYYDGKAEGIVLKNYDMQIFAKIVRSEFAEVRNMKFGSSPKKTNNDEEYLLEKYVTPRRIEKIIQKLIDEGQEVSMVMMKDLPHMVFDDVVAEEAHNIMRENVVVDFRKFRKLIAKRCKAVLQRYMMLTNLGME